ncbi:tetratricopeptide repeat protein [Aquimarina rhabdastrellae]
MKIKFFMALCFAASAVGFSQKQAIKSAQKALKSGKIDVAKEALKAAEGQLGAADGKTKAQFYFLKGQAYAAAGANATLADYETAANAYNKTIEVEKTSGKVKFSPKAETGIGAVRNALINSAVKDQTGKNYKGAADKLYLGYTTNKADTIYLYYAAANAVNGKDYDAALKYYNELKGLNFDGSQTEYVATEKKTGKEKVFSTKSERDLLVKAGEYIVPKQRQSASKKGEIAKNIALIYMSQGKNEEAIKAMEDAKKENPNDNGLLQAEADIQYKLGNLAKYKELMKEIIANDPNNADLYYNLGVSASKLGENDEALEYYKKAIELNPNYGSAQINIAAIILSKEGKIVEEMNGLGTSSKDYARYDVLKKERNNVYKSAVPYLEGALKANPENVEAVRTLMNIFYQLDDPKADIMKEKLKALENK